MKKIFSSLLLLTAPFSCKVFSQTLTASLGPGSLSNSEYIYIKSDATQAPSSIATLQFNIGIDTTGVTTPPTLTILSATTGAWSVIPSYSEGGYWNYGIYTATSPLTPNLTAGTELQLMEIQFTGGTPSMQNVALVTLPNGGVTNGNALFLSIGTVNSNGLGGLYYTRAGVTVSNQSSYDQAGVINGTGTSIASLGSVVVPVNFTNFSAVKQNDNASLTWAVANEGTSTESYVVERSFDGVDFKDIATVPVKGNGNLTSNSYSYKDNGLSLLNSSGVVYYRIKQVAKDGSVIYTTIGVIHLTNGLAITAYPNPVKDFLRLTLNLTEASTVTLDLSDANGKHLQQLQLAGAKGINFSNLNLSGYAAGNYLLKVNSGTGITTLNVVKQ